MNQTPLVSVIILSYKNYRYIYEAINSVILQDYNNIELIISNDGSADFNKAAISKYLNQHKKTNIKKIVINNNQKNLGTVKNINKAINLSNGDYIIMFAADDIMYKNKVVSSFVKAFDSLPKKELIVTSQIGMHDLKLKKLIQLFISNENKNKLKTLSPKKLFAQMAVQCFIPGSGTAYKKEIFKKYGIFDEKYQLVEDYSSALKLLRLGVKFNYFDFISFKHRDGGISHGNIMGDVSVSKIYEKDILNIMKYEIEPHIRLLNQKQQNKFYKIYKNRQWDYVYKYKYPNSTATKKAHYLIKFLDIILFKTANNSLHYLYRKVKHLIKK